MNDKDGQYAVQSGREYVFFSQEKAMQGEYADELVITTQSSLEYNDIYVIYSPNPFTKALDEQTSDVLPRDLSFDAFQKWLRTLRVKDPQSQVQIINIEISNP